MEKFDYMDKYGYEQLSFFCDKSAGLKAITCIHNTTLGPALGGTRVWNYSNEEEAAMDVLRLARGMTYKSALAGLALGGGKSVVIGDVKTLRRDPIRREAFWRAFGRYLEGMNGRYITAEDVGTSTQDMVYVHMETSNVVGLPGRSGDPSPFTALGVYKSMLACCYAVYGNSSVEGKTVAVQGAGSVGYELCRLLTEGGANVYVTDIDPARVKLCVDDLGVKAVEVNDIYTVDADIYSPNALGGTLNEDVIPVLKAKIVCGGANNQFGSSTKHAPMIQERGILYAPDYLANAGGVINVFYELAEGGYNKEASLRDVDRIYNRMLDVLRISEETGKTTHQIANNIAEERIAAVRSIKSILTSRKF